MGQEGRCLRLWARKPHLASLSCPSRGAHAVWILTLMGRPTAQPRAPSDGELPSGELLTRMKHSPANPGSQKREGVTVNTTLLVARVTEPEEASPRAHPGLRGSAPSHSAGSNARAQCPPRAHPGLRGSAPTQAGGALRPPRPAGLRAFTLNRLQRPSAVSTLQACVSDTEAHRSWALRPRGSEASGRCHRPVLPHSQQV